MNDASGEHVEDHAQALEEEGKEIAKGIENDEAHLDPSRWWFASAAFPMAAGTMGPVASAFSICALVRPWRQHIPPGSNVTLADFINDPPWLTIVNAIQLVVALVANVFLLLNMARRVRFTVAQPLTIVGWYLSSFSLIALAATAAGPLQVEMQPRIEYVWSQAFYYGIFAAIVYLIVASLMVVTFLGAQSGRYDKDFQLTASQRTLMLQTIMFLMYLLIGALVFSRIEGWAYLDAVYWADVTLFTVGFGDISASTPLGRALLLPYALIGVITLGLVIGSIRSLALDRGKRRLDARMIEKKRRRQIRRMTKRGEDGMLEPIQGGEDADGPAANVPAESDEATVTEFNRREKEFELMRTIQRKAAARRRWNAMGMSAGTWIVLWLVGAAIFQNCEAPYQEWSYFDGVYFAFVSLTTIGYGDVTPVSNSGKSFFVFWSLLALPTMTVLISNAGETVVKGIRDGTNALGTITILPGERGLRKDFKEVLRMISCGKIFTEDIEERAPGFLGAAQPAEDSSDSEEEDDGDGEGGEDDEDDEDSGVKVSEETKKNPEKTKDSAEAEATRTKKETLKPESGGKSELASKSPAASSSSPSPSPSPSPSRKPPDPPQRASTIRFAQLHKTSTGRTASSTQSSQTIPKPHLTHRESMPRTDFPKELPTSRTAYHCLLIDEIAEVSKHLRHQPPRKYNFAEWAFYLRLIGEDERNAETHHKAQPHVHHQHKEKAAAARQLQSPGAGGGSAGPETDAGNIETKGDERHDEETHQQWSWVGSRSPLMGSQEEAEWILEHLTKRLQAELRTVNKEMEEGEGKGTDGSGKENVTMAPTR